MDYFSRFLLIEFFCEIVLAISLREGLKYCYKEREKHRFLGQHFDFADTRRLFAPSNFYLFIYLSAKILKAYIILKIH